MLLATAAVVALASSTVSGVVPVRVVDTQIDPATCSLDMLYDPADDRLVVAYPHAPTSSLRVARVGCDSTEYQTLYDQGATGFDVSIALDSLGLLSGVHRSTGDPLGPAGLRYTLDGEALFGLSTVVIPATMNAQSPVYAMDQQDRPYAVFQGPTGEINLAMFDMKSGRWTVQAVPGPRSNPVPGRFLASRIDHQGRLVVAWCDEKLSVCVATLGSGGWSLRTHNVGPLISGSGLSLAVDSVDAPWVAVPTAAGLQVLRFSILNVAAQEVAPGVAAFIGPHSMVMDSSNRIRLAFYSGSDDSVYVATNDFGWNTTFVEAGASARSVCITLGRANRWVLGYCDTARSQIKVAGVGLWTTVQADFNCDGRVDSADREQFQACASGPAIPQDDANCLRADFDRDSDVDQADFAVFQRCWSGDQPANLHCAD